MLKSNNVLDFAVWKLTLEHLQMDVPLISASDNNGLSFEGMKITGLIKTHTGHFPLNTKEKWVPINDLVSAGLVF